jgi:hypothetical protein
MVRAPTFERIEWPGVDIGERGSILVFQVFVLIGDCRRVLSKFPLLTREIPGLLIWLIPSLSYV